MTSPFKRPSRTPKEVQDRKERLLAEGVARKLEGVTLPPTAPYMGNTAKAYAKHLVKEIHSKTELGWGEPEAIRLLKHHAKKAADVIEAGRWQWDLSTARGGPGGWNNLPLRAETQITNLRTWITPTLEIAEPEFDPSKALRARYDDLEAKHVDQARAVANKYSRLRGAANSHIRKKLRDAEREELQEVLDGMATAVRLWEKDLHAALAEVGLVL